VASRRLIAPPVLLFALAAIAAAGPALAGGDLNFGEPRVGRERAAPTQSDWLYDFVARMLEPDRTAAPRRMARIRPTTKTAAPARGTPPATLAAAGPVPPVPSAPAKTAPIVTGAIPPPARPAVPEPDRDALLMLEAERTQARHDLVKLELASRTYSERRLSGQPAFDFRTDWRVLERARDALTGPELSVAESTGFEANAYINEKDKLIVVAVAGTQDLRRDFLQADIWRALIQSQAPQQFFQAKSYIRSVMGRYQLQGYSTECVGHSLGGGACAYAAAELGIRAIVVNPISAGRLAEQARSLITNYVVDGDIATLIYGARGNDLTGEVRKVNDGRAIARDRLVERYGPLAGVVLVVDDLKNSVRVHQIDRALDLIAAHAGSERAR
jgi:hypothetical protein